MTTETPRDGVPGGDGNMPGPGGPGENAVPPTDRFPDVEPDPARGREAREALHDLPAGLRARFERLAELGAGRTGEPRPAQAVVLRVMEREPRLRASGVPLVWKGYHHFFAPDPRVHRVLSDPLDPHLTQVLDHGRAPGMVWEVCPSEGESTLAGYRERHQERTGAPLPAERVGEVVAQLHRALTALHGQGLVHRDVAPDNIVVREGPGGEPRVVLVDIGAAAPSDQGRPRHWVGKPLYVAPEAAAAVQTVAPGVDWWSLGMVIAELALGAHPIRLRERGLVLRRVSTEDVDLGGIRDPRLRALCEGLLTRSLRHRWGADQVGQWLAPEREDPVPVTRGSTAAHAPAARPAPRIRPFAFMGQEYSDREELAEALDRCHPSAARLLSSTARRTELADWAEQFTLAATTRNADSAAEGDDPADVRALLDRAPGPVGLARLLNRLGPHLPVTWHGIGLEGHQLPELVRQAAAGDRDAADLVVALAHPGLLTALAVRPGGEQLAATETQWRRLRDAWDAQTDELAMRQPRLRRRAVRSALNRDTAVDARLLLLARLPQTAGGWTQQAHRAARRLAVSVPWFERLLDEVDEPLRPAAALLLLRLAQDDAGRGYARLEERRQQQAAAALAADSDGLGREMRRLDMLPNLGWAVLGAVLVCAPWGFLIGLSDAAGRAPQSAVLIGWLLAMPGALAVHALELWIAVRIGPPGYHPSHSLAGLVIGTAERPARFVLSGRWARLAAGVLMAVLFLVVLPYVLLWAPWLWPVGTVAALAVWTVRRHHAWDREVRRQRALRAADRGTRAPAAVSGRRTA
ncbi:protein kinase [Streptomyces sp. NBC_01571]|uniref:protein kinase domain-containing protein n=1 Tax=Streptomyces sp. NBC_01571 TaxID=2975883 RepID=UPI0022546404|nr:protein kinase [Streptomyces sp. NBC_01571]MCX4572966.1 protein kinase [Streptomyces sp. NBC_01571]